MTSIDLMVRTSLQLAVVDPTNLEPQCFGSGCIVQYKEKLFLLSVAHVTDYEGLSTSIVTNNKSLKNNQTELYSVGAMRYYHEYKFSKDPRTEEIQSLDDLLKDFNETLDITFCEIKESLTLIQPEYDFGIYKVEKSDKLMINLDYSGTPSKDKYYGFCGNIRHTPPKDKRIESQVTLKYNLKFNRTKGRYHMFLASEVINDADDYRGCSGAPIINDDGQMVALAASVIRNTKIVYGFSIDECKRLLDIAIDTKLV